jgi:hypothetical protein
VKKDILIPFRKHTYTVEIDDCLYIATREVNGRVLAVRFAKGMTVDEIEQSLLKNYEPKDWKPYNSSTDEFLI